MSKEKFEEWMKSTGQNPPYATKRGYWEIWEAATASIQEDRDSRIAALEAERDALAAENVALKSYIKHECITNPASVFKTPSTNTFLRDQMAKGVEMFADVCSTANNGHEIHPDIEEIKAFAAQLRAGEAV